MPWYTTDHAIRDANNQRQLRECEVESGCWMCGIGKFNLMDGSDYLWSCDKCGYIGRLKVTPESRHCKNACSSLCAAGERCSVTEDGRCLASMPMSSGNK